MIKYIIAIMLLFTASCASKGPHGDYVSGDYKGYYKIGNPYQVDGVWYHPKEQPEYDETGVASWYGPDFHGKKTANGDTFDKHSLTAAHNTLPIPSMVRVTNLENNKTIIVMVNDRGPFKKGRVIDLSERAADILGYKDKGIAKVRVQFLKGQTRRLLADLSVDGRENSSVMSYNEEDDKNKPLSIVNNSSDNKTPPAVDELSKTLNESPKNSNKSPKIYISDNSSTASASDTTSATTPEAEATEKNASSAAASTETAPVVDGSAEQSPVPAGLHYIQAGTYGMRDNADRAEKSLMQLGKVDISELDAQDKKFYRVRLGPINDETDAKIALEKVIRLGYADAMIVSE